MLLALVVARLGAGLGESDLESDLDSDLEPAYRGMLTDLDRTGDVDSKAHSVAPSSSALRGGRGQRLSFQAGSD